jgi:Na+-transporting methylmalonyl-CoA/oxaloacetate decarboxylase gamma subunit
MSLNSITFDPSLLDSHVILVSILGYAVVLLALSAMAFLSIRMHKVRVWFKDRKLRSETKNEQPETQRTVMTGEENAAIATALFLFFSELHDQEKYVMTIKKVSRTYSPWSSKFYNIWNNMKYW